MERRRKMTEEEGKILEGLLATSQTRGLLYWQKWPFMSNVFGSV